MSVVGRTYMEKGQAVVVLAQWRAPTSSAAHNGTELVSTHRALAIINSPNLMNGSPARKSGPRNVLIKRHTGELVVRPFRGLRKRATNRVWYCSACGYTTQELPSGHITCARCGQTGLRGSEALPVRIKCPFEACTWSGWDDGGINDELPRHLRDHAPCPNSGTTHE